MHNLKGSLDLKEENLTIHSASIVVPPIEAEVKGTIAQLFKSGPLLDICATIEIKKEGPLAGIDSINVPEGTRVADISLEASGTIKEMKLSGTFSSNPLVTAETPNQRRSQRYTSIRRWFIHRRCHKCTLWRKYTFSVGNHEQPLEKGKNRQLERNCGHFS